jgi:hypothetical protein
VLEGPRLQPALKLLSQELHFELTKASLDWYSFEILRSLADQVLTSIDELRKDKGYRRYASNVERALSLFDTALQEWADYISFLSRLLKVLALFEGLRLAE